MRYLQSEPLKKHTSFKIGGPADYFYVPKSVEELKEALNFAKERHLPIAVMGAGTNLLALDKGFRGLVICLKGGLNWIEADKNYVRVGAGVPLPRLVNCLTRKRLSGLEFLVGIPGTVGGAVIMNAGAWGKDIGRIIERVRVLDKFGKERVIERKQLGFGYRKSNLQDGKSIIAEVELKLREDKLRSIKKRIEKYLEKKKGSQPLGSPNAGSVFKNPQGDFAGRLIEAAGCKGLRIGDAQISSKHANFILNLGEAKAKDVIRLITHVQKTIKGKFKIDLEPEVKIMVKSFA